MYIQKIIALLGLSIAIVSPIQLMGAAERGIVQPLRNPAVPSWLMSASLAATIRPDENWWQRGNLINPRKNFVSDLIGMSEDSFRRHMGWPRNKQFDRTRTRSGNWVTEWQDFEGQYRRAAVFQGNLISQKVQQWEIDANKVGALRSRGYFSILFYDPQLPWESDIRYLQSIPEHKNAAFQLASTFFGPLEGGIDDPAAKIENMFPHAAQGEEASAATAGATFYRKYCSGQDLYLLHHVKDLPRYTYHRKGRTEHSVDRDALKSYHYNHDDAQNVLVVAHDDIVVTAGYGPHEGRQRTGPQRGDNPGQRLTVYTHPNGTVDTTKSQIISQLFSSAINLRPFLDNDGNWRQDLRSHEIDSIIAAAKMALNASYAGTIAAAHALAKQRLFLTLMGGGAFRNKVYWIGEAIRRASIQNAVRDGMQITVMYHPDSRSRNERDDYEFLMHMIGVLDISNRTSLATRRDIQDDIRRYLHASYTTHDSHVASAIAKTLNDIFMRQVVR